jgi:ubiquinone/menaquinone biosynthesis C-methylase UbiE
MADLIKPEDIIAKYGIEGLCRTAEDYFKDMTDTTPLLTKPFHNIYEGPLLLCKLGLLLSGLRLGKSMTILDFGAGSCWLSRFLNELSCATISVDPSVTALKIGEQLFKDFPVISGSITEPRFLVFDGRKIDLEDNSVDRVICFDAFHHVPNPDDVMAEFYRVLKPGGIAGFSEVGPVHSTSPGSQHEMRTFNILENNIFIEHVKEVGEKIGFSEPYFKVFSHPDYEINYRDYLGMARKNKIPKPIHRHITHSMKDCPIFYLIKGEYVPDSRNHEQLEHRLTLEKTEYSVSAGEPLAITVYIENRGKASWLHSNINDIGVVNLGIHLLDKDNQVIDWDYARFNFGKPIRSGEKLTKEIAVKLEQKGRYHLVFDLVSEYVCWFETNGSKPVSAAVEVL